MRPLPLRILIVAVLLAGVLLPLAATGAAAQTEPAVPTAVESPPNIILILTDDQRWDTLEAMPNVQRFLVEKGITFENAFAQNPLCCPSRASILSGMSSASTGVYRNTQPNGGYDAFPPGFPTVATWLDPTYRTALVGKYLNGYRDAALAGIVPPGWDRWVAFAEDDPSYYDYALRLDGSTRPGGVLEGHGSERDDYSTDVLAHDAVSFVREAGGPFFLYFAPYAPHRPADAAPGDHRAFADLEPYRPESFSEPDVSDKPLWVQEKSPLTEHQRSVMDDVRRDQLASLQAVDRAVGDLVTELRETDRLHDTMIVFMSDNGYLLGEHRLHGKQAPYEESIRIPLVIRYDRMLGDDGPRTDDHLVLNLDLAPTFAEAAGLEVAGTDGRSLLPLINPEDPRAADPWRTSFLIEHLGFPDLMSRDIPSYCGVRTERFKYVSWEPGDRELYDLQIDPLELQDVAEDPGYRSVRASMERALARLCYPPPPGTSLP